MPRHGRLSAGSGLSNSKRRGRTVGPVKPIHKSLRGKRPFDIDDMLSRIEGAIGGYKKAAMFELFEHGFNTLFEQVVACIISIRTFDEVSAPTARKLFEVARMPAELARLGVRRIDELIRACTFHEPKARTIHGLAQRVVKEFGGEMPCDLETLMSFRGVGPKCAHLALGVACGQPYISV